MVHLNLHLPTITAEIMSDDEDWDPIRVKAAKRRLIQQKADRKRRKIKTERELASRQADPQIRERYIRTKHQAKTQTSRREPKLLSRKELPGSKIHKEWLSIYVRSIKQETQTSRREPKLLSRKAMPGSVKDAKQEGLKLNTR